MNTQSIPKTSVKKSIGKEEAARIILAKWRGYKVRRDTVFSRQVETGFKRLWSKKIFSYTYDSVMEAFFTWYRSPLLDKTSYKIRKIENEYQIVLLPKKVDQDVTIETMSTYEIALLVLSAKSTWHGGFKDVIRLDSFTISLNLFQGKREVLYKPLVHKTVTRSPLLVFQGYLAHIDILARAHEQFLSLACEDVSLLPATKTQLMAKLARSPRHCFPVLFEHVKLELGLLKLDKWDQRTILTAFQKKVEECPLLELPDLIEWTEEIKQKFLGIPLEKRPVGVRLPESVGSKLMFQERYVEDTLDSISTLTMRNLVTVMIDVAQAVKLFHELGYVHGDIRQKNIFVIKDQDGYRGTIFDFDLMQNIGLVPSKRMKINLCCQLGLMIPYMDLCDLIICFKNKLNSRFLKMTGKQYALAEKIIDQFEKDQQMVEKEIEDFFELKKLPPPDPKVIWESKSAEEKKTFVDKIDNLGKYTSITKLQDELQKLNKLLDDEHKAEEEDGEEEDDQSRNPYSIR